jgi:hypothetical protein
MVLSRTQRASPSPWFSIKENQNLLSYHFITLHNGISHAPPRGGGKWAGITTNDIFVFSLF